MEEPCYAPNYCHVKCFCQFITRITQYIESLAQDCSNSIANALHLLQSCTKPSILWCFTWEFHFMFSMVGKQEWFRPFFYFGHIRIQFGSIVVFEFSCPCPPNSSFLFQHFWSNFFRIYIRADSRLAPSQWETSLQGNAVSHWLGAKLESALYLSYLSASN